MIVFVCVHVGTFTYVCVWRSDTLVLCEWGVCLYEFMCTMCMQGLI